MSSARHDSSGRRRHTSPTSQWERASVAGARAQVGRETDIRGPHASVSTANAGATEVENGPAG